MHAAPSAVAHRVPRSRLAVTALAAVVAVLVVAAGWIGTRPAGAQTAGSLVLRQVDTTDPARSSLQFVYTGAASDATRAQLTDGGDVVDGTRVAPLPATTRVAVALVFDTASAMDTSGALVQAKDAAKRWVQGRNADQQANQVFAVYTTTDKGLQLQSFTSDTARIVGAIDQVAPPTTEAAREKSALYGAVRLAAEALGERDGYQPNIVVMTGTTDSVSTGSDRAAANGAVASSGATLFAAELTGNGFNPGQVQSLVDANGGIVVATADGGQFGGLVTGLGQAVSNQQYQMTFAAGGDAGSVADLVLTAGDQTGTASVVVGSSVQGKSALNPVAKASSGGVSALQGGLGLALVIVVALLAVGLLAYGVFMLFVRDDRLAAVLRPYDAAIANPDDDEDTDTSLARTAIVQRAVAITEQMADDRGLLVRAEAALERANLPLRAGEALFFYAVVVVILTLLSLVITGSVIVGFIVGVLAALTPVGVVNYLAAQRRKKFMALLPDTLSLLAGTLRAGYSLMQGVEAVSQEVDEPMGQELRRVVTEARLGRPLEDSLDGTAERMASPDFAWAVMAIRIQREVGGNLSELLMTVADTMVQRERLRRDVQSLTAEGRISAIILGILPVGLAAVMFVINPDYASKLITTGLGNVMLGLGVVSMLIGFAWMKKIITIEI